MGKRSNKYLRDNRSSKNYGDSKELKDLIGRYVVAKSDRIDLRDIEDVLVKYHLEIQQNRKELWRDFHVSDDKYLEFVYLSDKIKNNKLIVMKVDDVNLEYVEKQLRSYSKHVNHKCRCIGRVNNFIYMVSITIDYKEIVGSLEEHLKRLCD